jgi:hypothetical protein
MMNERFEMLYHLAYYEYVMEQIRKHKRYRHDSSDGKVPPIILTYDRDEAIKYVVDEKTNLFKEKSPFLFVVDAESIFDRVYSIVLESRSYPAVDYLIMGEFFSERKRSMKLPTIDKIVSHLRERSMDA